MFLKLLSAGMVSKRDLLIKYYSKIGLNENQLSIILIVMMLSADNVKFISPSEIAKNMSISKEIIEKEMAQLISSDLIKMNVAAKNKNIDLAPIFLKIVIIVENETSNNNIDSLFEMISSYYEEELTVSLKEQVEDLLNNGVPISYFLEHIMQKKYKDISAFLKGVKTNNSKNNVSFTHYNWLTDND